jgi:endonuclease YncB( thermonuclease family)
MEITLNNYNNLLLEIKKLISNNEQNLLEIIATQKIVTSWKIGKMVDEYLLTENRAKYGEQLFEQLEKDILINRRTLYQMSSFYKSYPSLPEAQSSLNWSHYKTLSTIKDSEKRKYFEKLTIKNGLSVENLQKEIAQTPLKKNLGRKTVKINDKNSELQTPLEFTRGELYIYKLANFANVNKTVIDCGFNIFTEVETALKADTIVKSSKNDEKYFLEKHLITSGNKMHTYKAYLEKVVDGDTLRVVLDLGFKTYHKEILRLAGINAPEKGTTSGTKSTNILKEILSKAEFLIIKTNKIDIYGRYIADVFFSNEKEIDAQKVADEGEYLNQKLIDLGAATKY